MPLRAVLEEAGVEDGAIAVLFSGLDRGTEDGGREQLRAQPVARRRPPRRGAARLRDERAAAAAPARLPAAARGARLVRDGEREVARAHHADRPPVRGHHQVRGYCLRQTPDEEGEPLSRMRPRSLLIPPGIPDSQPRERRLAPGPVTVRGRAWSGVAEIARVEVSADGGASWSDARLAPAASPWAWRAWEWDWDAPPGEHELCCRATRRRGRTPAARAGLEPRRLRQQRGPARPGDRRALTARRVRPSPPSARRAGGSRGRGWRRCGRSR